MDGVANASRPDAGDDINQRRDGRRLTDSCLHVTGLAVLEVQDVALGLRGAGHLAAGRVGFEMQQGGRFLGLNVEDAGGGIEGAGTPVGSAVVAGHLHGCAEGGRSIDALVACGEDDLLNLLALLRIGDVGVHLIGCELLPGEGWD